MEAPAHAVTETAPKTRMHKAGASEPRMKKARVTKAEASEVWTESESFITEEKVIIPPELELRVPRQLC